MRVVPAVLYAKGRSLGIPGLNSRQDAVMTLPSWDAQSSTQSVGDMLGTHSLTPSSFLIENVPEMSCFTVKGARRQRSPGWLPLPRGELGCGCVVL